ncbi:MAG: DUF4175 family protein [Bacteroidia bacterium]
MPESNYDILLAKLDAFIRKYYKNQIIKGIFYFFGIALADFLAVSLLEYYGHFNTPIRAGLFFFSLLLILLVFARYIAVPLAGLFRIGKRISHEQASLIIGNHFGEVKDKLLNTLQLKEKALHDTGNKDLIEASINQRSEELKPVPFVNAVDLSSNKKYLKYVMVPILAAVGLFFINARIMREGSLRLVNYDKQFATEAPFEFVLLNEQLSATQNQDVEIKLALKGEEIPMEVFLSMDGKRYKMLRDKDGHFVFPLRNVQQDFSFFFIADAFNSDEYAFDVMAKALLSNLSIRLDYPSYTHKPSETIENTGDLSIPQGTKVSWDLHTRNTSKVWLLFDEAPFEMEEKGSGHFIFKKNLAKSGPYFVALERLEDDQRDSIPYQINVIADAFPTIQVEEKEDSSLNRVNYFVGEVNDDYGFSALRFVYRFVSSEDPGKSGKGGNVDLPVDGKRNALQFYHVWDLKELGLKPGDKIEYYFEVYDNDGINGPKRAISQAKIYEVATEAQIKEEVEQQTETIKKDLEDALKETKKLGKDIQRLQKKLLEKKTLNWEDQKELEKLLQKQNELKQQIDEIKKQNEHNNKKENEFNPIQEQLMQKQQELEKLFNELFSDELKQMMEEMQRLMEEENKDLLKEELEKFELSEKELDKQLDRMLEMYKRFEVEKRLDQELEKMEELAEEQEKLAEETEKGNEAPEDLKEKQDSLNKKFDELQNDLEQTDSLNKELEDPMDFELPEEQLDSIDQDMEEGSEELGKKDKKEAAKKQKAAAKKMKKMAEEKKKEMKAMEMEQHMEDYETLRGILENLIQLSFDQEALMDELANTSGYSPKYVELVQRQKKIRDDARIVEDSLLALSKRAIVLRSYINSEMGKINDNLSKSLKLLASRELREATTSQQYTMTSMNNLAVMLSEILKNMQEDMMDASGSGGDSKKKSKPKPGDMEKMKGMQEKLGQELKKMKKGQQEGGKEPGSKEWAQMAAEQEMIRRMLQDLKKQMQEEGNGKEAGELQKTIEQMEKLEKDLVNKQLTLETIRRQQEIETRMLEHEKALKEREQDNKRESKEGKQNHAPLPPELQEYLKQKERENELLKTIPPELRPYYKDKIREYFRNITTP